MGTFERASTVPLSPEELVIASDIIGTDGVCIAHIQRRMKIGWHRAADLAEAIVGRDALPEVAKMRHAPRHEPG